MTSNARPKGLFLLDPANFDKIYGPAEREEIARLVDLYTDLHSAEQVKSDPSILAPAELIFSGWGAPEFDDAILSAAPALKAIFYGSGSVRGVATPAVWDRGIVLTSSWTANAVPVAEYALSQILFSLKLGWYYATRAKRDGAYPPHVPMPGAFGSTIGIISLGAIGRHLCELLRSFDVKIVAYEPFISPEDAQKLNVELLSLDDVFAHSDVVSLHAPWLPQTEGMITGRHFERMKPNATFINTARGALVREREMIDVLKRRPDLWAILDVTWPEPPAPGSELYKLPNVILTPHIAGSVDGECRRMGRYMVEELRRYLNAEPLKYQITREMAEKLA